MTLPHAILSIALAVAFGAMAGAVVMYLYIRPVQAVAESAEQLAAKQTGQIAQSIQKVSDSLKQPGQ